MRHFTRAVLALSCLIALSAAAEAQVVQYDDTITNATGQVVTGPQRVSAGKPLPVTGSFSATLSGFTPGGTTANLAVTSSSADVALPAGTVVKVVNWGATDVHFRVTVGAGTAVTTDEVLKAGAATGITVGSNTHLSAITDSSTSSLSLAGGSGLVSGYGGGGSGGGGAVTQSGTWTVQPGNTANTTAWKVDGSAVTQPTSVASGSNVVEGASNDSAACPSGSAKTMAGCLAQIHADAIAATPAGTNIIGKVGVDQTTPGTTNAVQAIAGTTGGTTPFTLTAANSTNATNIKASAGTLYHIGVYNNSATLAWVSFYNTAGTPSCGTSIVYQTMIPANSTSGAGAVEDFATGMAFGTGIGICITTGIAGTGSVAATSYVVGLGYK